MDINDFIDNPALKAIRKWDANDPAGWFAYIKEHWNRKECPWYRWSRDTMEVPTDNLETQTVPAGPITWCVVVPANSENESIINAMMLNDELWDRAWQKTVWRPETQDSYHMFRMKAMKQAGEA